MKELLILPKKGNVVGFIYKTTDLRNGFIYIGQHKGSNLKYLGSGKNLVKVIKLYGREFFKREILEYCTSLRDLNKKEIFWIKKLNARDPKIGYNLSPGGKGKRPSFWTLERKLLQSELAKTLNKHRWSKQEERNKLSNLNKERWKDS